MDPATLIISLPQNMKEYIWEKLREGHFSTPTEYIRFLIRDDQDLEGSPRRVLVARRGEQSRVKRDK